MEPREIIKYCECLAELILFSEGQATEAVKLGIVTQLVKHLASNDEDMLYAVLITLLSIQRRTTVYVIGELE